MEEKTITEYITDITKEYNKIKKIEEIQTLLLPNMYAIKKIKRILKKGRRKNVQKKENKSI